MITQESGVKKAVEWIVAELKANPNASRGLLIDQASARFHLSPLQTEYLYRQFLSPTAPASEPQR